MGSIVSTKPEPKKNVSENADKHKMHAPENIPSVFVNSRLLDFDSSTESAKVYEINGKMFTESVQDVTENFNKFKLYAERIDTRDMEILDSTAKTLDMDVQLFEVGYLVNSTVCLSVINYNTLIMVLDDYYNCFVCDLMVFNNDTYIDKHITDEDHEINMALFSPLEEFGMSVVRLKNEHYYCSVCNMSFHKNISEQHFNGKPHEDNLFLAANKVTDIKNNDMNIKNTNNYTIRNKNNDKILKISDDRVLNTEGKNKNEETINKNDYIMDCTVSVKIGKTVLEIPYYTWNMISISKSTNNNTFYCMACKMIDSIINMANHIADNLHDNNCKLFKINYAYENHLIRQDNTFSHCGTCNTINFLDGIDIHISMVHNKTKDTKELLTSVPKSELEPNNSTSVIKIENANSNNENRNNDIINRIMNERCIIFLFGMKISVLLLSLNAIFRQEFGFYCALCKVNFPFQYIHAHLDYIKNPTHMMVLNSIPALQQFGYNYIRSINNLPHCGICHAVIQPNVLLKHLQDQSHVMLTNIALGIVAPQQPVAIAKIAPNLKNEAPNVKYPINNNDLQNNDKTRDDNKNINEMSDVRNDVDVSAVINENTNNDNECNNDKLADFLEVEVALKKVNSQITLSSFNTLVPRGDGDRYCFVCEKPVQYEALKKHINNEKHIKLIKDIKFLEEYGNNLIRQKSVLYHCALCNVMLRRSELKNHISWPIHEDQKKNMTNIKKSQIKKLTKHVYATQKELIYREKDPELKVILSIALTDNKERVIDKTKVILLNGYNVKLKLKWDMWHSIASIKNAYKCILCQVPLNEKLNEIYEHIDTEQHNVKLTMPFMKEYLPTLLREVSENVYNCAVCNTELYNKENILIHVSGKRHKSKYKDLLNDSPDDSSEDVLLI